MLWTLMSKFTLIVLATAHLVFGGPTPLLANPVSTEHVQAELGSLVATLEPGASFWVILRLRMQPGWHTYWRNPGDSGLATAIDWQLPKGFEVGDLVWPYPQRIRVNTLMNYGYEGEVSLLTRLTAPETLELGQVILLRAQATWVVCAAICVPEAVTLDLRLPVRPGQAQEDARWRAVYAQVQPTLPQPVPWEVVFSRTQDRLVLSVAAPDVTATRLAEVTFFPLVYGLIDHAAPQQVSATDQGLQITLRRGTLDSAKLTRIDGVLVLKERRAGESHVRAFTIHATPGKTW